MNLTVNKLLSMQKSIVNRRNELIQLKSNTTTRQISRRTLTDGTMTEEITAPEYDVKALDRMTNKLTKALFEIDQSIKASNAVTKIDVDVNYNELMADIQ